MSWLSTFVRNERGSAGAEMALMLPLLTALLFGGMEGGYFFWREHQVVKVARETARIASRKPMAAFNCTDGTVSTSVSEGLSTVAQAALAGTVSVSAKTLPCITGSNTGLYAGRPTGAPVVSVTVAQDYKGLFATMILPADLSLSATAQSAVMGL